MKLQDLESSSVQKSQKVFESYFEKKIDLSTIDQTQALKMLDKVRSAIAEHRSSSKIHSSERSPAYLKALFLEQALSAKVNEGPAGRGRPGGYQAGFRAGAQGTLGTQGTTGNQQGPDDLSQMTAQERKAAQTAADKVAQGKTNLTPQEKAVMAKSTQMVAMTQANASGRSKMAQMLRQSANESVVLESEVQQAQVVLAAQDMVDRVQGMIEDITEMEYKDLPALVESIRNEVGTSEAQSYRETATASLEGLVEALQNAKGQLESAQGILTGQEPIVPGEGEMDMAVDVDDGEMDMDVDADAAPAEEPRSDLEAELGRARR